jgi:hypothetical protein
MSTKPTPPVTSAGIHAGRTHVSPEEFQVSTGLCRTIVYRLLSQKKVLSYRIGKRILIPVEELTAFAQRMSQK